MTSGQLRMLRISSSRARVWMLSESPSGLDRIVRSGRIGPLAEDSGIKTLAAVSAPSPKAMRYRCEP